MLLVYRRARPVSWLCTEHTTEHKCAQDTALHTTELALHTTGHICFDSLACLQITFLTFEYSLQLLVLPNVCFTTTENNALATIVPVTHLNARNPLVLVLNRHVHVPPFCLQLARLCAAQCSVVCSSARLCGGSPVIYVSVNLVSIGSDNGLSPILGQAIIHSQTSMPAPFSHDNGNESLIKMGVIT